MSIKRDLDDISAASQDAYWTGAKLMAIGALALTIGLAIIYAASIIVPAYRGT